MAHTKISLYTFVAYTHKNFSPRIVYTHGILLYTLSFYTHIYKQKPFSFLYEHDIYSQRFFLFIRIFGSFYFLGRCSSMKKTLHGSGISINTIDNNEVNTNITVQMTCMHKTRVNQNETNISPSVIQNKMIRNR